MYLRSDNGPEFVEKTLKRWLAKNGTEITDINYENRVSCVFIF
jgi:hypothetical protein